MEPFIGQIQPFGFNFPPRGWAFCDGQLLSISQNNALFSLLGTTFGGDGRTTFGLPELRGRSIVHVGNGPGLNPVQWGQKSGTDTITLSAANLPPHNHDFVLGGGIGNTAQGDGKFLAGNTVADTIYSNAAGSGRLGAGSVTGGGNGQSFNVKNPFQGIYVSIALTGIFPSRN